MPHHHSHYVALQSACSPPSAFCLPFFSCCFITLLTAFPPGIFRISSTLRDPLYLMCKLRTKGRSAHPRDAARFTNTEKHLEANPSLPHVRELSASVNQLLSLHVIISILYEIISKSYFSRQRRCWELRNYSSRNFIVVGTGVPEGGLRPKTSYRRCTNVVPTLYQRFLNVVPTFLKRF